MSQIHALSLIVVQLVICALLMRPASTTVPGQVSVWERYASPSSVFGAFYGVFFLLPQLYGVFADFHIISYEAASVPLRFEVFYRTQIWATLFLAAVLIGSELSSPGKRHGVGSSISRRQPSSQLISSRFELSGLQHSALCVYLVIGIAAYLLLAREFASVGGFRSGLVKTARGQALTALGFVANYAVAVYAARLFFRKRYLLSVLLVLPFSIAVLATGSRGRILWPLLIAVVVANGYKPGFSQTAKVSVVSFGTAALMVFDPLSAVLRGEQDIDVLAGLDVARLFEKRNFDGFANFARILNETQTTPDMTVLLRGGRGTFMNEFFPDIFERGVGFGTTFPGWFILAVGVPGMLILGFTFGVSLGLLKYLHVRAESVAARVAFLIFLSWYTAVGGNFVESLDKLVAAVAPGVVILALTAVYQHREPLLLPEAASAPLRSSQPVGVVAR